MLPLVSHGANLFNLCPFPDSSALYVQNWFQIRLAVWPQFPRGIVGLIVWAYVHTQMNPQRCTKFGANRSSRLTASRDFLNVWSPNPPRHAPWGIEGWLVFSLCPFPDESADVNQSWCQSVQPFDSFPCLLNIWPRSPPPPSALLCLSGQFVWRISIPRWICTCVPNLMPIGPAVWHLPQTFECVTP